MWPTLQSSQPNFCVIMTSLWYPSLLTKSNCYLNKSFISPSEIKCFRMPWTKRIHPDNFMLVSLASLFGIYLYEHLIAYKYIERNMALSRKFRWTMYGKARSSLKIYDKINAGSKSVKEQGFKKTPSLTSNCLGDSSQEVSHATNFLWEVGGPQ